jgi:broad specificity phosphatase PhoE
MRPISRVFTSPLRRATETAEVLGGVLGLTPVVDVRLRERMNWGDVDGQSFEEFVELWNRCCDDREFCPPGGDSSAGAGRRVEAFVRSIAGEGVVGEVVAVCHGGVIADFLLNVFSEAELRRVRPEFVTAPWSGDVMRESSVTSLAVDSDGFKLLSLGAMAVATVE